MKNKKSQMTLFIIIGFMIVIGIAMYIYFFQTVREDKPVLQSFVDDVPEQYKKVQFYVLKCVDSIATEAVIKIGENGGYISLNDPMYSANILTLTPFATESDGVNLGSSHPVPYWWYLKSNNRCTECEMSVGNIQTIEEIAVNIGKYVDNNLLECIGDFSSFKKEGMDVKVLKKSITKAIITDEKVIVQVVMPIDISKGASKSHLENFGVGLNVPLGKIYSAAFLLATKEADEQYLEALALNLITFYSGIDSSRLPPIAGFESGSRKVTWTKAAVKKNIEGMLTSYAQLFQLENTNGAEKIIVNDSIYEQAFYDNLYLENNLSLGNITVSFIYLDWPIYFDISPTEGETLKPSTYKNEFPMNLIPAIETQHYEFFYDISYPVVVELRDETAFDGRGYSFMFALEGNLRDNKNGLEWHVGEGTIGPYDYGRTTIGLRDGVNPEYEAGIDPETNETYNETFKLPPKSMMCDYNQQIGSSLEITVFSAKTKAPLPDATVSFGCGNYKSCPSLGATDRTGFFEATLPVCIGAYINIDKEDYMSKIIPNFSSVPDNDIKLDEVYLEPVRTKLASARIIPLSMVSSIYNASDVTEDYARVVHENALPMKKGENVLITVRKEKEYPYEQDFFQTVSLDYNVRQELRLVPGNFTLQLTFIDNNGVYIPAKNEFVGDEFVQYPPVNMTPAMLGSVNIAPETGGYWEISSKDLEKGYIMFYIIRIPDPKDIKDFEQFGSFDNYSKVYRQLLLPVFS